MKVLYVTAACLTRNTSANMSHNAFVKGLIDCGCEVEVIMSKASWGQEDSALPRFEGVEYHELESESWVEKLRKKGSCITGGAMSSELQTSRCPSSQSWGAVLKQTTRNFLKRCFYLLVPQDPLYPLETAIFKNVLSLCLQGEYGLVISNSSPAASHKVVELLLNKKRIVCKRWVQIWEDPWFYDLYGGKNEQIKIEEHRLLRAASEIYYVSPLTLMYQRKYFQDCAEKMNAVPLPFWELSTNNNVVVERDEQIFGYFGDYFSHTRNLKPFYEALVKTKNKGFIYGDSDFMFQSTDEIQVSSRVTLDVLSDVQLRTNVLVHLCNLHGGQIPGKIYHYSATNKKILFILDGTKDEQEKILEFFSRYNRYYFCRNNVDDICKAFNKMKDDDSILCSQVLAFQPEQVMKMILNRESVL